MIATDELLQLFACDSVWRATTSRNTEFKRIWIFISRTPNAEFPVSILTHSLELKLIQ